MSGGRCPICTFELGVQRGQAFIKCLTCGLHSFNFNDIDQKYCGNCHRFHDVQPEPTKLREKPEISQREDAGGSSSMIKSLHDKVKRRMEQQRAEFDAAAEFAKQYRRITRTPVVDDDYPEVRHDYDSALRTLVEKTMINRGPHFG